MVFMSTEELNVLDNSLYYINDKTKKQHKRADVTRRNKISFLTSAQYTMALSKSLTSNITLNNKHFKTEWIFLSLMEKLSGKCTEIAYCFTLMEH